MSTIYLIRHCATTGQEPEASLTEAGEQQAIALAAFLVGFGIERIISSPFRRAVQSIEPFAVNMGLTLETDVRLRERVLSPVPLDDWQALLQRSFAEPDFALPGGESSQSAGDRAEAAFREIAAAGKTTALVTHGNLTALLLGRLGLPFGASEQASLTNPDVFRVEVTANDSQITRLWESSK